MVLVASGLPILGSMLKHGFMASRRTKRRQAEVENLQEAVANAGYETAGYAGYFSSGFGGYGTGAAASLPLAAPSKLPVGTWALPLLLAPLTQGLHILGSRVIIHHAGCETRDFIPVRQPGSPLLWCLGAAAGNWHIIHDQG